MLAYALLDGLQWLPLHHGLQLVKDFLSPLLPPKRLLCANVTCIQVELPLENSVDLSCLPYMSILLNICLKSSVNLHPNLYDSKAHDKGARQGCYDPMGH